MSAKLKQKEPFGKIVKLAISDSDFQKFGCPSCGYRYANWYARGGGTLLRCNNAECYAVFVKFRDGMKELDKNYGFGGLEGEKGAFGRKLMRHPRRGKRSWGKREDKTPDASGEFFKLGELFGINGSACCFVCRDMDYSPEQKYIPDPDDLVDGGWHSKQPMLLHCCVATTSSENAAKRIREMFEKAKLSVTLVSPGPIEPAEFSDVRLAYCKKHLQNLEKLRKLTSSGVITKEIIRKVKALK